VPVLNWTGFYIGAHGGYGTASLRDSDGFFAGGHAGFNYQFANRFVFGVEGDLAWSNIGSSISSTSFGVTASASATIDAIGSLRGRIGYGLDRVLVYATGGVAFAHNELIASVTIPPVTASISDDRTHIGWTVGGGVEVLVMNNLTAKVEYLYSDYGTQTYFAGTPLVISGDLSSHTIKGGISFLFR
jgi:outer membrane immunogenic protein